MKQALVFCKNKCYASSLDLRLIDLDKGEFHEFKITCKFLVNKSILCFYKSSSSLFSHCFLSLFFFSFSF